MGMVLINLFDDLICLFINNNHMLVVHFWCNPTFLLFSRFLLLQTKQTNSMYACNGTICLLNIGFEDVSD